MLFRSTFSGAPFTLSLRSRTLTLGLDDGLVVAWDGGGRLYSVYHDGHTYRRSLGGAVLHKWRDGGRRHWETLPEERADALVGDVARLAGRILEAQSHRSWTWTPAPAADDRMCVATALERAARFTSVMARADAIEFWRIYEPIGILPPDQYLSIVLQATQGCSFNTCTFCDLHHEPYRVKTPAAFAEHASAALKWLGGSVELRRRAVFIGAANALAVPMPRLTALLGALEPVFGEHLPPLFAFVDGFTGTRKDPGDYERLRQLGLRRVYVGLESGHDPLLAFVRKPGTAGNAVATVQAIKQAGLSVAAIVMTGLGGSMFADAHVSDTIATLGAMPLDSTDLVYFSELVEREGTAYPRLAAEEGVRPLSSEACTAQRHAIQRAVEARFPAPPRMATYDVREFVY